VPVSVSYKKQFVLLFLLTVTFLTVVEVAVNIWLYYFYRCDFETSEVFIDVDEVTKRNICIETLGYNFVQDTVQWVEGTRDRPEFGGLDYNIVYINNHGFRGPDFTTKIPENTFRIFMMGGSTTFGSGVLDYQTYPYYLQQFFDKADLPFHVEVINAGKVGDYSLDEVKAAEKIIQKFDPDLFIVSDGWNDMIRGGNAIVWKDRWMQICELGKQKQFDTIITLQPIAITGKKVLTEQENDNIIKGRKRIPNLYPSYANQLNELEQHCTLTADLTNIFDDVIGPIYYDAVHVGAKGNKIVAKNLFEISLPIIIEGVKQKNFNNDEFPTSEVYQQLTLNNFEKFLDDSFIVLQEIVSPYKTPRISTIIFP